MPGHKFMKLQFPFLRVENLGSVCSFSVSVLQWH